MNPAGARKIILGDVALRWISGKIRGLRLQSPLLAQDKLVRATGRHVFVRTMETRQGDGISRLRDVHSVSPPQGLL
jgi:hypothetical protein